MRGIAAGLRALLTKGWQAKNQAKICVFSGSYATMRLMGGFGPEDGNQRGFCLGKEVPKPFFAGGGQVAA